MTSAAASVRRARGGDRRGAWRRQDDECRAGADRRRSRDRAAATARRGARSRARIAHEQGWTLGGEVDGTSGSNGDSRPIRACCSRRKASSPRGRFAIRLPSDFATIVLDEFHERSLHADIRSSRARPGAPATICGSSRMSATIDPRPISHLDNCPIVEVPGREHPVEIEHAPGETVARAVEVGVAAHVRHDSLFPAGSARDPPRR